MKNNIIWKLMETTKLKIIRFIIESKYNSEYFWIAEETRWWEQA